jgi:capsid protein
MVIVAAGSVDRMLGSWAIAPHDPNDQYGFDGVSTSSRGEWLYDNDAIARAITECILGNALGPSGLQMRSTYQSDPDNNASPADIKIREQIERGIKAGTQDFRFDASGMATRSEMSKVMLQTQIANGVAYAVRESQPARNGRPSHATCARIIHPLRVSNPGFIPNNQKYRDGYELDALKNPTAIWVQRTHPNTVWTLQQFVWDRIPLYDAQGWPLVTIAGRPRIAEQIRPLTWFTPIMQLLRFYGSTLEAKVVADRLKASMGLIVECDNPEAAAAADRNGAMLNSNTKIVPGKVYYCKKGTHLTPLNFDYKGEDFDRWMQVILTNVCAAFQIPYEFVLQQLTKSNMASSRVALSQAYQTFHGIQDDFIARVEAAWNDWLIREDVLRGRIDVEAPADDDVERWDAILSSEYMRPARMMPDPSREADAAVTWIKKLGKSYTRAFADAGMNFNDETSHLQRDNQLLKDRDIELETTAGAPPGDSDFNDDEEAAATNDTAKQGAA